MKKDSKAVSVLKFIVVFLFLNIVINKVRAQQIRKGFSSPESVVSNGQRYFVSNIGPGSDKIGDDSDGFISEISSNGKIVDLHFLPVEGTLSSPHGIDISGNVLYVADIDNVFGFDIKTRKRVFSMKLISDIGLLNDLAVVNDSLIVVSDIFKNKIYEINIRTKQSIMIGEIGGPNGLIYDKASGVLYACSVGDNNNGQGHIYKKKLSENQVQWEELKGDVTGFFDGITLLDPNQLLVSDWISMKSTRGRLVLYNLKQKKGKSFNFGASPADIFYDKRRDQLFVPQTNLNQITILKPNDLKNKKL